jgi:glycosyltransferase involved in cell wall biosynthesis
MTLTSSSTSIAVVIPCYNEALTIEKVVSDFRRVLPSASIVVFDNNSTDDSAALAEHAGAVVVREKRQGKGSVVSAILNTVDADYYVMVDGDDTYPADAVFGLLAPIMRGEADMVTGQRLSTFAEHSFRPLHVVGNKLVRTLVNLSFGVHLRDIMSGYRAFTREVAEHVPVVASGFDVETEMTLQLLYRRFVIREIPIAYRARRAGSVSKLNTVKDGTRVLAKIGSVLQAYKPLTFFGSVAIILCVVGLFIGHFVIREYIDYRYIFSVPKAILAAGLMVLAFLSASLGLLLHTINFRILEMTRVLSKQINRGRAEARWAAAHPLYERGVAAHPSVHLAGDVPVAIPIERGDSIVSRPGW